MLPAVPDADRRMMELAVGLFENTAPANFEELVFSIDDVDDFLSAVERVGRVYASRYVPGALKAIGRKASEGNVPAARLLCEIVGLIKRPTSTVNVATQVNVSPAELEEIRRDILCAIEGS